MPVFGLVAPGVANVLVDSFIVACRILPREMQLDSSLRKSRRIRAARRTGSEGKEEEGSTELGRFYKTWRGNSTVYQKEGDSIPE